MFRIMPFKKPLLILTAFMAFALFSMTAEAGTLTLVNASASQLSAIYISDSGSGDWEENLIQGSILPPGNQLDIQIQGSYSKFDLRIEAVGGGEEDYFDFPGNARRIVIRGNGDSEYQ